MSDHGKFEIKFDREVGHVFHCVCGKFFHTAHAAADHVSTSTPDAPAAEASAPASEPAPQA